MWGLFFFFSFHLEFINFDLWSLAGLDRNSKSLGRAESERFYFIGL